MVDQYFKGKFLEKYSFQTLLHQYADGHQHSGILGISYAHLFNDQFMKGIGGWDTIGWLTTYLAQMLAEQIPLTLRGKIPTEETVHSMEELQNFLHTQNHPLSEFPKKLSETPPQSLIHTWVRDLETSLASPLRFAHYSFIWTSPTGEEFEIELRNCRITADSIKIIKKPANTNE
jgi:CO dehydrogenase/acetyl-CoA synthase beta subunit